LERHGATEEEIDFLEEDRVELKALTAPEFVELLETKLAEHAPKVVPDQSVIEAHSPRIWEQQACNIDKMPSSLLNTAKRAFRI
jgi:hypothetical protein